MRKVLYRWALDRIQYPLKLVLVREANHGDRVCDQSATTPFGVRWGALCLSNLHGTEDSDDGDVRLGVEVAAVAGVGSLAQPRLGAKRASSYMAERYTTTISTYDLFKQRVIQEFSWNYHPSAQ